MLRWNRCCLLLATTLIAAAGCTEDPKLTSVEPCADRAVLSLNPATGDCEWVNDCAQPTWQACTRNQYSCSDLPNAACGLDSRCQLVSTPTGQACQGIDLGPCAGLDEWTCTTVPGCRPEYDESGGGGAPIADDEARIAPEYDPYLGCFPDPQPLTCWDLYDPWSCQENPGCQWTETDGDQPVPMPEPCECPSGSDCECGGSGLIAPGYCEPQTPPPVQCYDYYDMGSCTSDPRCLWYEDGADPMPCTGDGCGMPAPMGYCGEAPPAPTCANNYDELTCASQPGCEWIFSDSNCACDPSVPDCGCFFPSGYCTDTTVTPDSCFDHYDEYTCISDPQCEWIGPTGSGEAPVPPPCTCEPGDPDCTCDGSGDIMILYCQPKSDTPPPPPSNCYDAYDLYSCTSLSGCEWIDNGGMPEPCDCPIDDPNCGCTAPAPSGYCQPSTPADACNDYGDAGSCTANTTCEWFPHDTAPPCDPNTDPTCKTEPDPCWGAWTDETGTCRAPNDGLYPAECCIDTAGTCQSRPEPTPECGTLWDAIICDETPGCHWMDYTDGGGGGGAPDPGFRIAGECLAD